MIGLGVSTDDRYGDRHIVDKMLNFDRTEEIMPDQYVFLLGPHVKFPIWLLEHTNVRNPINAIYRSVTYY